MVCCSYNMLSSRVAAAGLLSPLYLPIASIKIATWADGTFNSFEGRK